VGPVRLCVIGLGRMGLLYTEIIATVVKGAELAGVLSRSRGKAGSVASKYGVRAYGCLDEVLRDPGVDGVVVTTPTYTHAEIVARAAEAGKHVFVEKPLDVDVSKAEEAVRAVRRYGVKLLVGYMRRFDDQYLKAKELISEGAIGKPVAYVGISKDPEPPPSGWLRDPNLSGGLVLDLMTHDVDLAHWYLGGEVTEVYAVGDAYLHEDLGRVGDQDLVTAHLRFGNGASATLLASRFSGYGYDVRSEIHGTAGTVFIGSPTPPNHVIVGREGGLRTYLTSLSAWFKERFLKAYIKEVEHFTTVIREDKEPLVSGEDALKALKVGVAIRKSLKEGRPIHV